MASAQSTVVVRLTEAQQHILMDVLTAHLENLQQWGDSARYEEVTEIEFIVTQAVVEE